MGGVPEVLVHHLDEQQVELRGVGLVGRHQVGEEAHRQHRLLGHLDHAHGLHILQAGIYGHVQIVRILYLHLLEFLVELLVFLAFLDDVGVGVGRVLQSLLEEGHRDQI